MSQRPERSGGSSHRTPAPFGPEAQAAPGIDGPAGIVSAGLQTFVAVEPLSAPHAATLTTVLGAAGGRIARSRSGHGVGAFDQADAAVRAIVALQSAGASARADDDGALRAAVHTGDAWSRPDGDVAGPAVRRVVRLVEAADRGQVLVSSAASPGIARYLFDGWSLVDLGVHRL